MDRSAFTLAEFCVRNRISRSKFWEIRRKGKGPRVMEVDGIKRVTADAERDWQKANEVATEQAATVAA